MAGDIWEDTWDPGKSDFSSEAEGNEKEIYHDLKRMPSVYKIPTLEGKKNPFSLRVTAKEMHTVVPELMSNPE